MFSFSLFFMCKHEKKEDEEGREQQLSLSYIFWPSCDEGVKKEVIDLKKHCHGAQFYPKLPLK